jgi:Mce-associated membrane protein
VIPRHDLADGDAADGAADPVDGDGVGVATADDDAGTGPAVADGDAAGGGTSHPRRQARRLVVVAAVLLVAAVVASTLAAVFYARGRDDRAELRDVRATAAQVVTALTTYDYTNLDGFRNQVLAIATGKFRQEFDQAFDPLRQSLTETKARSVGRVTKVYVGDVADGASEAVVIADQVVTTATGSHEVPGQQLTVSLVRVGGRWRADGLTYDVVSPEATASPGAAPAAVPTTSPPTTR